jgi:hypothetical protein
MHAFGANAAIATGICGAKDNVLHVSGLFVPNNIIGGIDTLSVHIDLEVANNSSLSKEGVCWIADKSSRRCDAY